MRRWVCTCQVCGCPVSPSWAQLDKNSFILIKSNSPSSSKHFARSSQRFTGMCLVPKDTMYPDKIRKHTRSSHMLERNPAFLEGGFSSRSFLTSLRQLCSFCPCGGRGNYSIDNSGKIYIRLMWVRWEKQEDGLGSAIWWTFLVYFGHWGIRCELHC